MAADKKSKDVELKECPFCGGEAELNYGYVGMTLCIWVQCSKCKARSAEEGAHLNSCAKDVVVSRWNDRVKGDSNG